MESQAVFAEFQGERDLTTLVMFLVCLFVQWIAVLHHPWVLGFSGELH